MELLAQGTVSSELTSRAALTAGEVVVRGRVNSGVQSVVRVRKVMVVDMVGMVRMLVVKVVKAVSRL